MKHTDNRTHAYAVQATDFPQHQGNFKQVRQADQDWKESRAAGGDNERDLGYLPKGLNARIDKPTERQFQQWRDDEPGLLRRLQNGDERAAELLVQRYSWWLRVRVGRAVRKVSGGLFFGDIFSCVLIRFLECLKTFRPRSNNGLRAYLDKAIDGAISDAQQEWQSKGFGGFDTRLRRFLRSGAMLDNLSPLQLQKLFPHHTAEQLAGRNEENRKLGLEEIQKLFPNYTLDEIAQAQEPIVMQPYSEGAVDDGNGYQDDADSGYAVAAASADPVNAQRSTSSQYSKRAALGYRWPKEHAQRNVFAYQVSPRKRVYGSPWVDLVERYSAARDEAFLKHLGRQKFTEWKMEHRCTANTGDWDENGNWRPTEHRRLIEDGPSSRVVAVLNEYRSDSVADLVTAATTSHLIQGNKYGPANAPRRNLYRARQRA